MKHLNSIRMSSSVEAALGRGGISPRNRLLTVYVLYLLHQKWLQ